MASRQEDAAAGGLWQITAKLNFPFVPDKTYAFLTAVAEHPQIIEVETLSLRTTPVPQAELALVAYFRKQVLETRP
jgi:hypothetical protein